MIGEVTVTDPDGDTPIFYIDSGPARGTVTLDQTTGAFTYTPDAEARHDAAADGALADALSDTFTLAVTDGSGGTTLIEVTTAVSPANTNPTAAVTVGDPDTDGVATGELDATDADGDTLTYSIATGPAKGTVTLDEATGTFTYTPDAEARHDAAADGATADAFSDTFTVAITDGHGGTTLIEVTTAVSPANDAPEGTVTVGDPDTDGVATGELDATDADGDTLTYTIATGPAKGTVTLDEATGTFTYTPDAEARHDAAADGATADALSDTFTVAITDGHGGTTLIEVTTAVSPANDAPEGTVTVGDPDTDGVATGELDATDADGDTLTYTIATGPAKGTVTLDEATGTFTYTPDPDARHDAAADGATADALSDTFTVAITDGHGGTTLIEVTTAVSPTNENPTATSTAGDPDTSAGAVAGAVIGSDTDGDTLVYSIAAGPAKGTVTLDEATGTFTYTPDPDARHDAAADGATAADQSDTFTVAVTDGHGGTTLIEVTTAVSPANENPVATDTVGEPDTNGVVLGALTITDPDGDSTDLRLVTFASITGPNKGTLVLNEDGTFVYTPRAEARHAAAADDATAADQSDSFTVVVSDGYGGRTIRRVSLPVAPANEAPVGTANTSAPGGGGTIPGELVFTDADGDTLTYAITEGVAKGTLTLDSATGGFTYTPDPEARHNAAADDATEADRTDAVTFTVSDGFGGTVVVEVALTVSPANTAPTADAAVADPVEPTGEVAGTVDGADADSDTLTYAITSGPANGTVTLDPNTGEFVYTPDPAARHAVAAEGSSDGSGDGGGTPSETAITPNNVLIIDAAYSTVTANVTDRLEAVGHTVTVTTDLSSIPTDTSSFQQVWDLRYPTALTPEEQSSYQAFVTNGGFAYFTTENPGCCTDRNNSVAAVVTALGGGSTTIGGQAGTTNDVGSNVNTTYVTEGVVVNFAYVSAIENSQGIPLISDNGGKVAAMSWIGRAGALAEGVTGTIITVADINWLDSTRFSTADGATLAQQENVTALDDIIRGVVAGTVAGTISASGNGTGTAPTEDTFTITVNDGHGGTRAVSITVPITPANAEPTASTTIGDPDAGTGAIAGAVIGDDADGDTLSYSLTNAATKGSVVVGSDGAFTYTPTSSARHAAAADGAGPELTTDTFTVSIADGYGGTLSVPVTVMVEPANALPTATVNQAATFVNGDFTDALTGWTAINTRVKLDGTDTVAGWATPMDPTTAPDGGVEASGGSGSYSTAVTSGRAVMNSSLGGVTNTPAGSGGVIHGPVVVSDSAVYIRSGATVRFDWEASGGGDAFDVLAYMLDVNTGATYIMLDATGANASTTQPVTVVNFPVNQDGNYKFVFVSGSWDATGGSVAGARLSIDNVEVLNNVVAGEVNGTITGTDPDQDTLTYTVTTNPATGALQLDTATGSFSYTAQTPGVADSFVVTIDDGHGGTIEVLVAV